jgi:hypothetical protein
MRHPGRKFDEICGYGRVNALQAVLAVEKGRIPPMADLGTPDWFDIVSPRQTPWVPVTGSMRVPRGAHANFVLEYALGVEPVDEAFLPVASGEVSEAREGTLGALDFGKLPLPSGPPPVTREDRDRYTVTVRLRVTDDRGLTAEARRSFFVFDDPLWKPSFPAAWERPVRPPLSWWTSTATAATRWCWRPPTACSASWSGRAVRCGSGACSTARRRH